MEIGETVWSFVEKWNFFHKDSLGKQFIRAADSIALNISKGYGCYFLQRTATFVIEAEV